MTTSMSTSRMQLGKLTAACNIAARELYAATASLRGLQRFEELMED